jgi:catechol 2,3-dioxygenase-like lactoylglutathione lyase family enzyme
MTQASSLFKGVGQVGVVTTKADQIVAFYRDVMGFPLLFEAGGMSFLQAGATSVMVGASPEPVDGDTILYFEPNDWSAAEAKLESAGVTFERDAQVLQREDKREHVLRPFRDPEGRRLYLLGWRPCA